MSPFLYADQIKRRSCSSTAQADNNSGTVPDPVRAALQAIQGNGGTARLVLLPHESHGYLGPRVGPARARREFDWLERWLAGETAGEG